MLRNIFKAIAEEFEDDPVKGMVLIFLAVCTLLITVLFALLFAILLKIIFGGMA